MIRTQTSHCARLIRSQRTLISSMACYRTRARQGVVVCVDFDKTMTTKDTISLLFDATNMSCSSETERATHRQQVNELVQLYMKDLNALTRPIRHQTPSEQRFNHQALAQYLDEFSRIDLTSIHRVVASKTLSGLNASDLEAIGRSVVMMDGCVDTLSLVGKVSVVSSNWSKTMILSALQHAGINNAQVISNELLMDDRGVTTGAIDLVMQSPTDKANSVRQQKSASPESMVVFLGDSINDLAALVEADVGVVLEFAIDSTLGQLCNAMGIQVQPLAEATDIQECVEILRHATERDERVVFSAKSWSEVSTVLWSSH